MLKVLAAACACLALACCREAPRGEQRDGNQAATANVSVASPGAVEIPPAPGTPGALADDQTPVSEAPFEAKSAQGAGQVLQSYFALIEQGKYDEAWKLRWKGKADDRAARRAFAESFARYAEYHATIGAPGPVAGAAGSLFVDIPVQIYGTTREGKSIASAGTITLRMVNDVPGSTAEQRSWRIYSND